MKTVHFERAIFLSWYCSKRDCAFCYLSTNPRIDPKKDRRSTASILAEAIICKACGWKIEFLSGGCDTFSDSELLFLLKNIYEITEQKQWLNVGTLKEKQIEMFRPYVEGLCGTVECVTPGLRDKICPSKPLSEIEEMFELCNKIGLKKTITFIIGLGETINDFTHLKEFINKNKVDKITFYRLKPQKGTIFENSEGPEMEYYAEWIKKTRKTFPKIEIVVGSWLTHLDEIHVLLKSGADSITKFPSIQKFNTKYAKKIEQEVKKAGMKFVGTLTKAPKINLDILKRLSLDEKLEKQIEIKAREYIDQMKSNYS